MKWYFILMLIVLTMNSYPQKPNRAETIDLKGIQTYYEVYGRGKPLFLLHGFTQSSQSWKQFIPEYDNEYEVYLVDLMGHGKSSPFIEKVSLRSAAQNLSDLIEYLGLESINAIGYSYGGEILFQLALINPNLIKTMIVVGSCGTWNAKEFPEFVEYLSYKNLENLTWMHDQQTSEERIRNILDQVPNYFVNLSEDELKSIKSRTLLVVGDSDYTVPLECTIRTKTNMPNAFLWIVPNTGHRVHLDSNKYQFINTSKEFLSGNNW
jgi:pimeloyl-ACP methyl ester carboxylesterase